MVRGRRLFDQVLTGKFPLTPLVATEIKFPGAHILFATGVPGKPRPRSKGVGGELHKEAERKPYQGGVPPPFFYSPVEKPTQDDYSISSAIYGGECDGSE